MLATKRVALLITNLGIAAREVGLAAAFPVARTDPI